MRLTITQISVQIKSSVPIKANQKINTVLFLDQADEQAQLSASTLIHIQSWVCIIVNTLTHHGDALALSKLFIFSCIHTVQLDYAHEESLQGLLTDSGTCANSNTYTFLRTSSFSKRPHVALELIRKTLISMALFKQ